MQWTLAEGQAETKVKEKRLAVHAMDIVNVQAAVLLPFSRQLTSQRVSYRNVHQPTLSVERAWIESYLLQDAHDRLEPTGSLTRPLFCSDVNAPHLQALSLQQVSGIPARYLEASSCVVELALCKCTERT